MTKQLSLGVKDTPIDGVSSLALDRAVLNFPSDFRLKNQTADEVTLVNITSQFDRPETIRISRRDIANIYTTNFGKGVSPASQLTSVQGTELLAQWNGTFEVTDTTDADYVRHLPLQAHLVIKTPKGADFTCVQTAIARLISSLFDSGAAETAVAGLEAKLRGALIPKGL